MILGCPSDLSRLFSLIFSKRTSDCFWESFTLPGEITSKIGLWAPLFLSLLVLALKFQFCNDIKRLPNWSLKCKEIFTYWASLPRILHEFNWILNYNIRRILLSQKWINSLQKGLLNSLRLRQNIAWYNLNFTSVPIN